MPATVNIEGTPHTVEKLADGRLRVSHPSPQDMPTRGHGTEGDHWFIIHPCQRNQYEFWLNQLSAEERAAPSTGSLGTPWWSSTASSAGRGEKDGE